METPRATRAAESLHETLELLWSGREVVSIASRVGRLERIVSNCDLLEPIDDAFGNHPVSSEFTQISSRPDYGILPPVAYVFQALDSDDICIDPARRTGFGPMAMVMNRQVAGSYLPDAVPCSSDLFNGSCPLVGFADLKHPLTQAIVGVDIFSRLSDTIDEVMLPMDNDRPLSDEDVKTNIGIRTINASVLAELLVAARSGDPDVADWYVDNAAKFADSIGSDRASYAWTTPPAGTELADACSHEPLTAGLLRSHIKVQGIVEYGKRNDYSPLDTALTVGMNV